jgi:hypothetical protein
MEDLCTDKHPSAYGFPQCAQQENKSVDVAISAAKNFTFTRYLTDFAYTAKKKTNFCGLAIGCQK